MAPAPVADGQPAPVPVAPPAQQEVVAPTPQPAPVAEPAMVGGDEAKPSAQDILAAIRNRGS